MDSQLQRERRRIEPPSPSLRVPCSASPNASSSSSRHWKYHVFLSFRGEDVRENFLSHIRKEFQRKGIKMFVDEEIGKGQTIGPKLIEAIRESMIYIVVLSKNYASSRWCLDELLEILKWRDTARQNVKPIFYGVDPSDVRYQKSHFGDAFKKTCHRTTEEKKKRWEKALTDVADMSGYHFKHWDNEAKVIEEIAVDISRALNFSTASRDFDNLVRIDTVMDELISRLCLESSEVKVIGIWGAAGIGKTTITRALCDRLSSIFQRHHIMVNIGKDVPRTNLDDHGIKLYLQRQCLSEMLNEKNLEVPHLGVLKDRLKYLKVLLVLDGVDNAKQLEALAGNTEWFGSGSRIVVTAEDKNLLDGHKIDDIYELDLPSKLEAREIFCQSAFGEISPPDDFRLLTFKVINCIGHLPLGLKVIGSSLREKNKDYWEGALRRFGTNLNREIERVLRFGYDSLEEEDQVIFRHIACFFNHMHVEYLKQMDADMDLDADHGLRNLTSRCLIRISEESGIEMHNLLEQLGRKIVREQSQKPWKREFIVDRKDLCELLEDNPGATRVLGISIMYSSEDDQLSRSRGPLKGVRNLRVLHLLGCVLNLYLSEDSTDLPRKLSLLEWDYYPMVSLPQQLHTESLVNIELMFSKLEKLWDGIKGLGRLKIMNLSDSAKLKEIPNLSTATGLETLDLSDCKKLEELPLSIQHLNRLKRLILYGCSQLKNLPSNINLESLEELDLEDCEELKCFPGISQNVKHLNLSGAKIEEVPSSVRHWPRLTYLNMTKCTNLKTFPRVPNCIDTLLLSETAIEEVPPWIEDFSELCRLDVASCEQLKHISSNIFKLKRLITLDFSYCSGLRGFLPSLELPETNKGLGRLKVMDSSSSSNLNEFPDLSTAIGLATLNPSHCIELQELPPTQHFNKLTSLILCQCIEVKNLPSNINLASLEELNLDGCKELKCFPEISRNVKRLNLRNTKIEEVPSSVSHWPRLTYLDMTKCTNLKTFPRVPNCIDTLLFSETAIEEVPPWIVDFSELSCLEMAFCERLKHISSNIFKLKRLITLDFSYCSGLRGFLPSLESPETSSRSFNNPQMVINVSNCFQLNEEARQLLEQSVCRYAFLPSEELPPNITHRTNGGFLAIQSYKLPTSGSLDSKPYLLLAAILRMDHKYSILGCQVKGRHGDTVFKVEWLEHLFDYFVLASGKQQERLVIFTVCNWSEEHVVAELSHDETLLEINCIGWNCEVKEVGVQLLDPEHFHVKDG